jgi:hypothetical protein
VVVVVSWLMPSVPAAAITHPQPIAVASGSQRASCRLRCATAKYGMQNSSHDSPVWSADQRCTFWKYRVT